MLVLYTENGIIPINQSIIYLTGSVQDRIF